MESTTNESKKIILVDDDEDLLYTFNYWLMSKGFTTIALTEPNDMASFIRSFQPSLILIDVSLKENDGRDICKYVKTQLHYQRPVILFSSYDYSEAEVADCGADGVFQKTSDHLLMVRYISQFL